MPSNNINSDARIVFTYQPTLNSGSVVDKPIVDGIMSNLPDFYDSENSSGNYRFIDSIGSSLTEWDVELNDTNLAMFISTAQGNEIDLVAEYFNLYRYSGETDSHLRGRVRSFIPGFIGGGVESSIVLNFWNRWGWTVDTVDYPEPNPLFKLRLNVYPALADLNSGAVTFAEVIDYANMVKAAGCGFIPVFYTVIDVDNGENIIDITDGYPILSESALFEIFYDDDDAYYDGSGMYGFEVLYNAGFDYNSGWTYGGLTGNGYWDSGKWDLNVWV